MKTYKVEMFWSKSKKIPKLLKIRYLRDRPRKIYLPKKSELVLCKSIFFRKNIDLQRTSSDFFGRYIFLGLSRKYLIFKSLGIFLDLDQNISTLYVFIRCKIHEESLIMMLDRGANPNVQIYDVSVQIQSLTRSGSI